MERLYFPNTCVQDAMNIRSVRVLSARRGGENSDLLRQLADARRELRRLRSSEARLRMIIERNYDGMLVMDAQGIICFANPAAEALMGKRAVDLVGEVFGWPMATAEATEVDLVHRGGEAAVAEMRVVEIEWEGHPAFLASFRDVTERKRAEHQALELALERERTHVLTEFIRDASHEFRTPLSVINLSLYLLEHTDDFPQRKVHSDKISEQIVRMTALVEALVTMSRLDRYVCLHQRKTDLRELVHVICVMCKSSIQAAQLSLTLEVEGDNLWVQGDVDELDIALKQLIDNAIRFTPPGGRIVVRGYRNSHWAIVEVTDTGIGIAETALPHIFERFYRADTAHTSHGFGLGLPIARRIVEGHHGRIEVQSALGTGSTFRVMLPIVHPV